MAERLQPDTEVDQADFERRIYHLQDTSFSFRGREELPIIPAMQSSQVEILGAQERPNWVKTKDYDRYLETVKSNNSTADSEASIHLLTPKTLLGVVELALRLGANDPDLPKVRDELSQRQFSDKALQIIDQVMAVATIDDQGKLREEFDQDAEAIVILAILGDVKAKSIVATKLLQLHQLDAESTATQIQQSVEHDQKYIPDVEPVDPQELVAVHVTDYPPEILPDGTVLINPTGEATSGKLIRNSVHFTLNHKVASHLAGNWEEKGYVILTSFPNVLEADGPPSNLDGVDTWWNLNPGQKLKLPEAKVIEIKSGEDSDQIVNEAVAASGRPVFAGGAHYIQDPEMQKKINKYATEIGSTVGLHEYKLEAQAAHGLLVATQFAREKLEDGGYGDFDWAKYNPSESTDFFASSVGSSDAQTRRAIYASGMLVAHGPISKSKPDQPLGIE